MNLNIEALTGTALNWAVAYVLGILSSADAPVVTVTGLPFRAQAMTFEPATNGAHAEPLIRELRISVLWRDGIAAKSAPYWWACVAGDPTDEETTGMCGETPLLAAMRGLVFERLNRGVDPEVDDEVTVIDVPDTVATADATTEQRNAERIARRIRKDMPASNPSSHW